MFLLYFLSLNLIFLFSSYYLFLFFIIVGFTYFVLQFRVNFINTPSRLVSLYQHVFDKNQFFGNNAIEEVKIVDRSSESNQEF